ncbi:hypothetical protein LINPERHAP1_LOCUS22985 [Linum perenne]
MKIPKLPPIYPHPHLHNSWCLSPFDTPSHQRLSPKTCSDRRGPLSFSRPFSPEDFFRPSSSHRHVCRRSANIGVLPRRVSLDS